MWHTTPCRWAMFVLGAALLGAGLPCAFQARAQELVRIPHEKIAQIVEGFLQEKAGPEMGTARIVEVKVPEDIHLPAGAIGYSIKPARELPGYLGKIPLLITFRHGKGQEKRVLVTVHVESLGDALFAKRAIKKRKLITEEDLEVRRVDLGNMPPGVLTRSEDVVGRKTTQAIGEEAVLTQDLVDLAPMVSRGDIVLVIAERDGMKVSTLAEVKTQGRRGDVVRVMNLESKKTVYAKVMDHHTVRVNF